MNNESPLLNNPRTFGIDDEFVEGLHRRKAQEGVEGLLLAVLEDAIACYQKYVLAQTGRGKALFREAEDWILEKDSGWPFSFEDICEVLAIDSNYLRQGLVHWKEKILAEVSASN